MKTKPLALALTALVLALAPRAARAEDEVSFQFFYDTLSPLGEWVRVGDYGDCWHPTGVDEDWAPYTDGYWSYTDAGWTWVSYEDWGGICYHYGRWVRTDEIGWCWVPDYEWGPAWVSWRNNETDIGWAPLPPECRWRASIGISTWADDTYDIGPGCYTFCPIVDFGAPLIRTVCYPRARNVFFIGSTFNITNITYNSYHNVVFCGGPNFLFINQHVHRPIPSLKLVLNGNLNRGGHAWTNARNVGNTLQVYAPKIVNNNTTIINKPTITKVVNKTQVNRGWNVVQDQNERQKLRAQIKEQNHGLTAENAPAKPIKAEDLKFVPEKADLQAPSPVAIAHRGGKDRNGDGVPNNQPGGTVGKDRNGDGIPDNQKGQVGVGRGPKVGNQDLNGDGIPDNRQGQGGTGKGPKVVGKDLNGDGIPDRPNHPQGGFQPGDPKAPKGTGELSPRGQNDGQVEKHNKRDLEDAQLQQQEAARRQAEMAERQRRAQEQQLIERQKHQEDLQKRQAEMQERAIQNQRNQQAERQQELKRPPQPDVQRQPQPEVQRPHQPQPQQVVPQNNAGGGQSRGGGGGGGGQGKGRPLTPEEVEALKKQHGQ